MLSSQLQIVAPSFSVLAPGTEPPGHLNAIFTLVPPTISVGSPPPPGTVIPAKYGQVQPMAGTTVVGVLPGGLKLNKTGASYRRRGRTIVVHLAKVKPPFLEIDALFTLLTPFAEISVDEFHYSAPGGYLEIWNDLAIMPTLVADGDTAAIPITNIPVGSQFGQAGGINAITTLDLPRTTF